MQGSNRFPDTSWCHCRFFFTVNTQAQMSLACQCSMSDWTLDTESSLRGKKAKLKKTKKQRKQAPGSILITWKMFGSLTGKK